MIVSSRLLHKWGHNIQLVCDTLTAHTTTNNHIDWLLLVSPVPHTPYLVWLQNGCLSKCNQEWSKISLANWCENLKKPITDTTPRLPTSIVIISALYPLFWASSLNSRYFSVFLWMAASKAVSRDTVSSMRVTSFGLLGQITISGWRSVVVSWSGYWYIAPGRSALMFAPRGRRGLMKCAIHWGLNRLVGSSQL